MLGRRLLLWARLLVGVGFMYQGVTRITEMRTAAELFARAGGWQSWPLVGGIRPLELVLWLALLEFFFGGWWPSSSSASSSPPSAWPVAC
jgi:hypothetical protein